MFSKDKVLSYTFNDLGDSLTRFIYFYKVKCNFMQSML